MKLYTKILKAELSVVNKISNGCSVEVSRSVMNNIGRMLILKHKSSVTVESAALGELRAGYITPRDIKRDMLILYLHGGGYVLGGMDYAEGFGSLIAAETHTSVCCLDYRLAPEHRYPAAIDDAFEMYRRILGSGTPPEKIVLCGESAGGGLVFALALKLKDEGLPLPRGIIAMSPWSDLTLSGDSYNFNRANDPSMTEKRLRFYAESYADDLSDPYISPLFGDLTGLPPSLILVGGHEIMLSDSILLYNKLIRQGCRSTLHIAPEMWHVYLMYNIAEARGGYGRINNFLGELFDEQ